jgi:hypothetical protein
MTRRTQAHALSRLPLPLMLACVLALAGCAYEIVSGGEINRVKADQIIAGIQQLRQLRFKHSVPLVLKTRDQAEQMMEADLARDYSDEQMKVDGTAGAMLGLYPIGIDLKAETLALMRNQVAAFYDLHGKQMVMVEGGSDLGFWSGAAEFLIQRDVGGEMILAHEMTHALQDQNFDLGDKLDAVKNDDDRALALKSVAEGDATIAGLAYVMGGMDGATLDTILSRLDRIPQAFAAEDSNAPQGLSDPLLFQYTDGVRFVADAWRRGGWSAVDALYRNPPQSSRQILHPTLYFDYPTPPQRIDVDGYEQVMAGWKKADDDTYGELLLKIILQRNLGHDDPGVALAAQWSGDRLVILREGRGINVIWILGFTDSAAAASFATVYASLLDKLLGSTGHAIDYRGSYVMVVAGEGAHYMATLAPSVWAHSRVNGAAMPAAN